MADPFVFFTALVRVETRLWNVIDARLRAEHDLPVGSLQFLRLMSGPGPCRVQDISCALDLTVGATSKAVDRLEARGFCERQANPDDRRSSLLVLTTAGREKLAAATPTFDAAMTRLLAALPADAVAGLERGLEVLERELDG
ncbi:MarR family winged helix-turn-helix transcriptional regulator [Cryptosporangium aurantiacum]|uniref:Transcriptional regulator n=1 Tax=Cryptosporangium aurantiacum TaxID=134849 RepID=A0A1M7RKI6_9ACTN|nr:MarR family winged helix-turn-helix transcriptional regulator [Cryptosporangium aurantiacum]SHN46669.1 transcriptional regulator [Cryptosporangium aurantiacum]